MTSSAYFPLRMKAGIVVVDFSLFVNLKICRNGNFNPLGNGGYSACNYIFNFLCQKKEDSGKIP